MRLLGRADVSTTMIYTHVLNRGGRGVQSPLDRLKNGGSDRHLAGSFLGEIARKPSGPEEEASPRLDEG
jgi:hypothetical protein